MEVGFHFQDDSYTGPEIGAATFLDVGGWGSAQHARQRMCRPYFTGRPDPVGVAQKANEWAARGCPVVLGNEPNLPAEGFGGGPAEYAAWFLDAANVAWVGTRLYYAGMSPSGDWRSWYTHPLARSAISRAAGLCIHAYGELEQMEEIVGWIHEQYPTTPLWLSEFNWGAGRKIADPDAWVQATVPPFLDWLARIPQVEAACWFSWRWDQSPTLPSSVDGAGTGVERVLREWTPPKEPPMATIKGIDISNNNGPVDLAAVKQAGYQFVAIKASQDTPGGGFRDVYFAGNWADAGEGGLARIAYHMTDARYASPAQSIGLVQEMVDGVGGLATGDAVALDAELGPMTQTWLAEALDLASRVFNHLVWKYSGDWYTSQQGLENPAFERYPTWFVGAPGDAEQPGWRPVRMWQTTVASGVPGVTGACDVNTFLGTLADLKALGRPAPIVAPEVSALWDRIWVDKDAAYGLNRGRLGDDLVEAVRRDKGEIT